MPHVGATGKAEEPAGSAPSGVAVGDGDPEHANGLATADSNAEHADGLATADSNPEHANDLAVADSNAEHANDLATAEGDPGHATDLAVADGNAEHANDLATADSDPGHTNGLATTDGSSRPADDTAVSDESPEPVDGPAASDLSAPARRKRAAAARRGRQAPSQPGRLRTVWAMLIAVAGGLALASAFPPTGIWPLAAAGPALLVVALWGRSLRGSFVVALAFGLAFFFPLLSWLINVAWYALAALAIAEAVIFALFAIGQRLMLRLPAWPVPVAAWWVAVEAFRDRWPYAFPWGRLAMSQAAAPTVHWVAYGGPQLLSFLVALTGATLAWLLLTAGQAWRDRRERHKRQDQQDQQDQPEHRRPAARRLVAPALAFAGVAGVCVAGAALPAGQSAGAPTAEVAAIQGDVPHDESLAKQLRQTIVTQNHAAATEQLAAEVRAGSRPAPDLVIWPENSTDQDPDYDPAIYATIYDAVSTINRPVLVGAVLQYPERNAGQLWLPGRGPVAIYVKRQLVPFGEYIPFRGIISSFSSLPSLQPVNFTAGHKAVVFTVGKIRLGDVICYEVGFDNLVSSEVGAGANLLTEQTNDADFEVDGQLGETLQQLAMARIRAIEFDRSMVVAGTTGVSAIILPNGTFVARSQTWQRALLEARVPLVSSTTLAQRLGEWPEIVFSALAVVALGWAVGLQIAERRGRRSRTAEPAVPA
jgi:apolipoprotein N-acyltransferase